MATKNRRPKRSGLSDLDRYELLGSDIEFEPLEETYLDEEDSFSEMFQRLERTGHSDMTSPSADPFLEQDCFRPVLQCAACARQQAA